MFIHNLIFSLKILFKNKSLIFWTFIFPIVLGLLFYMSFSNIENEEVFNTIDIGVVDNDNFKNNYIYNLSLKYLSEDNNKIFNITYDDLDSLKELLEDNKIVGYLYIENEPHIVIKKSGLNESVFKYVIEEINTISKGIEKFDIKDLDNIKNYSISLLNGEVKKNNTTNKNMSYTMVEFYTLIAMSCLYGAILSMYSMNQVLPNMTNKGKRIAISPNSKLKIILSSLCASFIAQTLSIFLLLSFTIFILNVDYGNNILFVLLLSLTGSLAGLSFGVFVSAFIKKNENTKLGIIIAITMLYSFFAGMMGIPIKYRIDKNMPIINKLNPVNMITDGLYSLYYYDTYERFIYNIISLLIYSFILISISYFILRRQKYDSI